MFSHSYVPCINKPTRVTRRSCTLIDNIFCNTIAEDTKNVSGILYNDVSDHFPVFHIDYTNHFDNSRKTYKNRAYTSENIQRFSDVMQDKNWHHIMDINDTQTAYSTFHNELNDVYTTCFPIKVYTHGYRNRKPWLSDGMKISIKEKNKLYRQQKLSGNPEHEIIYKQYRNKLNKLMLHAERDHYQNLLEENKSNLKNHGVFLKKLSIKER